MKTPFLQRPAHANWSAQNSSSLSLSLQNDTKSPLRFLTTSRKLLASVAMLSSSDLTLEASARIFRLLSICYLTEDFWCTSTKVAGTNQERFLVKPYLIGDFSSNFLMIATRKFFTSLRKLNTSFSLTFLVAIWVFKILFATKLHLFCCWASRLTCRLHPKRQFWQCPNFLLDTSLKKCF